jgi:hypothetical protein
LTRCEFEFVEKLAEYVITIILVDIFSNLCSDLEKTSFSTGSILDLESRKISFKTKPDLTNIF